MKYEWFFQLVAGCSMLFWGLEVRAGRIPASMMEIRVVDDLGAPVAGASAEAGWESGPLDIKGLTDTNGIFRFEEPITGALGCEVRKDGYYRVVGELWWGPMQGKPLPPTNQYTVVLKRIVHPVPMQMRSVETMLPKDAMRAGFDLEAGDWVQPHGKGLKSDIVVEMVYETPLAREYKKVQSLAFPGPDDGIVPLPKCPGGSLAVASALPVPQIAPSTGFTNSLQLVQMKRPGEDAIDSSRDHSFYLFRVRTKTNAAGQVDQANVGWIGPDFNLSGPRQLLRFKYYFNPNPHSRSLEPESIASWQNKK